MRAHGGNHHEKLGLKRIWCASQCTIPNTAGTSPNPACNFTDTRSCQPNRASHTHDLSYPVVPSTLFPSSFSISLPRPQPEYHRRTQSYVIPVCLSMLWSWVDTEYSIQRPQHTPSTAHTQYGIHLTLFVIPFIFMITSWPLNVASAAGVPPNTINCHQQALRESPKVRSPFVRFPPLQVN